MELGKRNRPKCPSRLDFAADLKTGDIHPKHLIFRKFFPEFSQLGKIVFPTPPWVGAISGSVAEWFKAVLLKSTEG